MISISNNKSARSDAESSSYLSAVTLTREQTSLSDTPAFSTSVELQRRWERVASEPLAFIMSRDFTLPNADDIFLAPLPKNNKASAKVHAPAALDAYFKSLYKVPLLSPDQEQHAFRRYNYQKFCAKNARDSIELQCLSDDVLRPIEERIADAQSTRNSILQANLRLVVSVASKFCSKNIELNDLISAGNLTLVKAINAFDYSREFKFSTYATAALNNLYRRMVPNEIKVLTRLGNSSSELLQLLSDPEREIQARNEHTDALRQGIKNALLNLSDSRERKILSLRFGLDASPKPLTLREVGDSLGITKERVRQLEIRAIRNLIPLLKREPLIADTLPERDQIAPAPKIYPHRISGEFMLGFRQNETLLTLAEVFRDNKNASLTVGEIRSQLAKVFEPEEIPILFDQWLESLCKVNFLRQSATSSGLFTASLSQAFLKSLVHECQSSPDIRTRFGSLIELYNS